MELITTIATPPEHLEVVREHLERFNISGDFLEKYLTKGYAAKDSLKTLFSLGDDYRRAISVEDTQAVVGSNYFRTLRDLLPSVGQDDLLSWISTGYAIEERDGKTVKVRLGKYLTKHINKEFFALVASRRGLPGNLNDFVSQMREEVVCMKRQVILSANPLDILLGGDFCNYEVCHSFSGIGSAQYLNGNISYGLDDFTLIAFTSETDTFPFDKTARVWVYIRQKALGFVIGNQKGNMGQSVITQLSSAISTRLAGHLGVENKWVAKSQSEETWKYPSRKVTNCKYRDSDQYGPVFFDIYPSRVVVHRSLVGSADSALDVAPTIRFHEALCLACGSVHNDAGKGTCDGCNDSHGNCFDCGDRLTSRYREDDDGDMFCVTCYNKRYFRCRECGEENNRDDGRTDPSGRTVCESCFDDRYTTCDKCDDVIQVEDYVTAYRWTNWGVRTERVCADCARNHYTACTECDDFTYNNNLQDGICPDCGSACGHCEKRIAHDEWEEHVRSCAADEAAEETQEEGQREVA